MSDYRETCGSIGPIKLSADLPDDNVINFRTNNIFYDYTYNALEREEEWSDDEYEQFCDKERALQKRVIAFIKKNLSCSELEQTTKTNLQLSTGLYFLSKLIINGGHDIESLLDECESIIAGQLKNGA
jgi:hypothetical protein